MGFINSLGLIALISVPILILLYMLRPKNQPMILPSLYLWKSMASEIESASKFQKFKSSILLVLQILIVSLITLMLAGLFLRSGSAPKNVILVMDCSVSMESTDLAPSRMEAAKEQAKTYIRGLDDQSRVTLVALKDTTEILLTDENDHGRIMATLSELQTVDGYGDLSLAVETCQALRQTPETEIVYFGDRVFPGATNYKTARSNNNVGVSALTYTAYAEQGTVSALGDLMNYGPDVLTVPVSLYADGLLLDAKQVEIQGGEGAKVFFDGIPIETGELKLQIDLEDILSIDNTAYAIIGKTAVKKAVLITQSNLYLEKILKLIPGIELYVAEPSAVNTVSDYDLYIYDGLLPVELPEDGAVMLLNPPDNSFLTVLGHAENPTITVAEHEITTHIENPEFAIGRTQVFEVPGWGKEILGTEYGACALAGNYQGINLVVYGFDLHHTDLPMTVEFPIMMINSLGYLTPSSMLSAGSISAGSPMSIRILPSTTEGSITTPDGRIEELDLSKEEYLNLETNVAGIYTVSQTGKNGTLTEKFAVNVPKSGAGGVLGEAKEVIEGNNDQQSSLLGILGFICLIIILAEWLIYHQRRKINAVRF